MSIATNETLKWSDIQALYNNLNTARKKFGITTITVPDNPGVVKPAQVQALNDNVNSMSANSYLRTVARTGVTPPAAGTIIKPLEFNRISTTITNIQNTCAYDSSYYSSHCGYDSTYDSSYNSSYDSSDTCSCVGFSFSWYSSDRSCDYDDYRA